MQINRLLFDEDERKDQGVSDSNQSKEYISTAKEFRAFLSDWKDVLDEATTMKLLGRYDRKVSSMHYEVTRQV